jgi:outer membrane protein insertion porin family
MMIFSRLIVALALLTLAAVAQTRVRVIGMQFKSESELIELMGERLVHIVTDVASASRADDAAFILSQVMRNDGYANVQVTARVVNSREILLTVNEGGRLSLGQVTVRGEPAEDARRLAQIYSRPATQNRPIGAGAAPFRQDDVERGLALIVQDLQAIGHWAAEAELAEQRTDPTTGFVDVVIDVRRGPLHRISEPRIESADGRGVVRTRTTAAPFVGLPASTGNLNQMRTAVQEAFTSRGYPDAQIRMEREIESPLFIPEFVFDLGQRVKLNQVRIEGLRRTSPARLHQRVRDLEGDWYNEAEMNRRLRQFLSTGAFSSASIETEEIEPRTVNALLRLNEARAKEINFAAGFGSYEGGIFRTTYTDRNLLGQLLNFSSGFEISARGLLGELSVTDPWIFGSDYSLTGRLYALSRNNEGYNTFESGIGFQSNRKFGSNYSIDLLAGWSIVNLSTDGLTRSELGESVYGHTRLAVTQSLDFRDSSVLPTKGWHLRWPIQLGAAIGDNSTTYISTSVESGWYHQFNRTYQLNLGAEIGLLIPIGDRADFPIDLRLFNGGARSVRSFPERRLGPTGTDNYPTGGEAYWVANAELVRTLGGPLKLVGFLDAGGLSGEYRDLPSAEMELALGLGVRLDLPVGPVRFEYGHNLTPGRGEPSGTWHFAIGIGF